MNRIRFMSKGLAAAIILSALIAFMISLIPNMGRLKLDKELPVFTQQKQVYITENNIVDFIVSFPLDMQIKRVSWKYKTLAIDYAITENMDTSVVYKDIYFTIKKSFIQGSNIDQVLIRVFLKDMDKIFVAVSADKKDLKDNPTLDLETSMLYKDFLDQYFGLNYGNIIKED